MRENQVAVWSVIEKLSGAELLAWRLAEVPGRASPEERNLTFPHPFGWFVACYSDELGVREVKPLRYFDRDLVIWRGEDGRARVLDGYCRHLGAHMGVGGRVAGNQLECPFHGWRYDETGAVREISYAAAIPPRVRKPCQHQWPVVEKNQCVWFWYHPFGAAPQWDVRDFPETSDRAWTPYERFEWNIWGSIQNMAENTVDAAHFQFVHGLQEVPTFKHNFDGHERSASMVADTETAFGDTSIDIAFGSIGPGQIWTRFRGMAEILLLTGVTPVRKDQVHLRLAFTQPRAQVDGPLASAARMFVDGICTQLDQDKVIWDRQRFAPEPVLCGGDGPIAAFRESYRQFYAELLGTPAVPAHAT